MCGQRLKLRDNVIVITTGSAAPKSSLSAAKMQETETQDKRMRAFFLQIHEKNKLKPSPTGIYQGGWSGRPTGYSLALCPSATMPTMPKFLPGSTENSNVIQGKVLTLVSQSIYQSLVNANASLTMSLAQTPYCREQHYDPQSPLCAHVIMSGSVQEVPAPESDKAKTALFSRHPEMATWPRDHNWFFAKLNITNIWVLDYFGGIKTVTPEEYYRAKP